MFPAPAPLLDPSQISSFSFLQLSTLIYIRDGHVIDYNIIHRIRNYLIDIDQTSFIEYKLTSSRSPVFWHLTAPCPAPAAWRVPGRTNAAPATLQRREPWPHWLYRHYVKSEGTPLKISMVYVYILSSVSTLNTFMILITNLTICDSDSTNSTCFFVAWWM